MHTMSFHTLLHSATKAAIKASADSYTTGSVSVSLRIGHAEITIFSEDGTRWLQEFRYQVTKAIDEFLSCG